jgi:LssY C-terminus
MKTCLNLRLLLLGVALFWCAPQRTLAQETSPPPAPSAASSANATAYQFDMDATKEWIDTKVDLRQDEKIRLTATGTITYPADKKHPDGRTFGPEGLARGFDDLIHEYAVPNSGHGSLIARLGSDDGAQAFAVGKSLEYEAPVGGRLFLGINQSMKDAAAATGNFQVKMEIIRPGLSTSAAIAVGGPPETPVPFITPTLLSKIPRRISDHVGNPGDMVNIFIIGSQAELEKVFSAAGWVHVDSTVQNTVMNALVDSFEKKDYLTMPMSILYLFDRPQDYGFAHAEPVRVAMSRNHLRAWKSPYLVDGRTLWCIAATHDIGFERDQRNNGLTHKIDPSIDGEREYVNDTLSETGLVVQRAHVTPSNPLLTAKTATGGEFHSDGRILVLVLKVKTPSAAN